MYRFTCSNFKKKNLYKKNKIVESNFHSTTEYALIHTFKNIDFLTCQTINVKHHIIKITLPLIFIDLKRTVYNQDIFKIL